MLGYYRTGGSNQNFTRLWGVNTYGPSVDNYYPDNCWLSPSSTKAVRLPVGTPNTIDICKNCGEPVIQYNNTGSWKHYPEHPLNIVATDCLAPFVKAIDRVTPSYASTNKTAVKRS